MNTTSPHFTMQHLILGLGRVTKSLRVCICPPEWEALMLAKARAGFEGEEPC